MINAIWPCLAAVIGVLVYALTNNAKVAEIGRALMWTGFLVTLFVVANHTVRL